jgi:uncharacterized protein YndB with AHSA1/START domain
MLIYMVRLRVPAARLSEALMDTDRPWSLPEVTLGQAERVAANAVRLSAGGSSADISWNEEDGGRGCRMVVRHDPKEALLPRQSPEESWREAWPFLVVRLKSFLEGVALLEVPPLGGPDGAEVTLSAHFPVSPERLFAALTDPKELDAWIADGAKVDLSPGGAYDYAWRQDGPAHVLAVDPNRTLETDWRFSTAKAEGRVTWTVGPEDGGARLTLVHHGFGARHGNWPRDAYIWGWADFLQALALYLAGAGPADAWRGPVAAAK